MRMETGQTFVIGPDKTMRNELIKCIDLILSEQNLMLAGQPGTGKRTLARALKVLFPKHQMIELDCEELSTLIGTRTPTSNDYSEIESDLGIDGTFMASKERYIVIENFHQLAMDRNIHSCIKHLLQHNLDSGIIIATVSSHALQDVRNDRFARELQRLFKPVHIKLPSIKHRKHDIPVFAHHFMRKATARFCRYPLYLNEDMERILLCHHYHCQK